MKYSMDLKEIKDSFLKNEPKDSSYAYIKYI